MRELSKEAVEDGIPYTYNAEKKVYCYYPPCRICDSPAKSMVYVRGAKYTCELCRRRIIQVRCHLSENPSVMEKEKRLKKALSRISKVADLKHYEEAITKVRKGFNIENYYQSTEEIMAALELLRRGYVIYHQKEIADFHVDFLIPELSVVLEVDGEPFHAINKAKSDMRDYLIESILGSDYRVVHMPTKYINKDVTKLVYAIKKIKEKSALFPDFALHE